LTLRIARLDLARYGHFTDVTLTLPKAKSDFHLIYGPNEAGKSTTRAAVAELLFGMDPRTPFNFLHDYADLRIGALLEAPSGPLEVVRLKRNKNPLVDPAGQPIDAEAWRQLVGSTDRAFFERMFALDHQQLVEGGQTMLNSSTDVGRALFQAASGLGHFSRVRSDLAAEAGTFWASRARKDVRYFMAKGRLEEAQRALREHALTESALKSLLSDCTRAEAEAETAGRQRIEAHVRATQLQRIRRVGPKLQQLATVDADCAAAAESTLLPPDAREIFQNYAATTSTAESAILNIEDSVAEQQARLDALYVDLAVLEHAGQIDALVGELSSVQSAFGDLPKRRVEREQLRRDIQLGLADLGLPEMEPDKVLSMLLSAPLRERLRGLADQYSEHERSAAARQAALDAAAGTFSALTSELDRLGPAPVSEWDELVAAGSAVFDSASPRQLALAVAGAESAAEAALEALTWEGGVERLRFVRPPALETVKTQLAALISNRAQLSELVHPTRGLALDIAQLNAEIRELQTGSVPDAAALTGARGERDGVVSDLMSGAASLQNLGSVLRERISHADAIADLRYADAQAAATLDGKLAQQAGLRARAAALSEQAGALEVEIRQVEGEWTAELSDAGLPPIAMEGFSDWLERRARVIAAADELRRAREMLSEFDATAAAEAERLNAALRRERPPGMVEGDWLRTLVAAARAAQQEATARRGRREELQRQIEEQQSVMLREQGAIDRLRVKAAEWAKQWTSACTSASLPAETLPRSLDRVLGTIDDVRNKVGQFIREQEARIVPMERNIADYEARVIDCVAHAAPALAGQPTFEAVRDLSSRLRAARQSSQSSDELQRIMREQRAKLRAHHEARDAARARLGSLLRASATDDPEELDVVITASDNRRALETRRTQLCADVLELGDGHSLLSLKAEFAAIDPSSLDAELEATRAIHAAAEAKEHQARATAVLARDLLDRRGGSDSAARASSAKSRAQREMTDAAETFIGLQAQAFMLDWALARFRDEQQAPLLQRANGYFVQLTCGTHAKLVADGEGASLALSSRRAGLGSPKVPIAGMSDGTRDQLYLALRLAAVDLHLDNNIALPFIADDLAVNSDETRSVAALRALSRLSERTQTFYFTHHANLAQLARQHLGDGVNVIELAA
jgi:uncharacterized protein YhaN